MALHNEVLHSSASPNWQEPDWQPINMLPVLANHASDIPESAADQTHLLTEAPAGKLDAATLDRWAHAHTEHPEPHQAAHWLYEQQRARSQTKHPGADRLATFAAHVAQLRPTHDRSR